MAEPHLSEMNPARISECASRYHTHPLRLVQIENFLPLSIADKVGQLLASQAEFGPVYGLHKTPGHIVDHEIWLESDEKNRFFHYEMLAGINGNNLGIDALTFLKLRQFLSSDIFCAFARQITEEEIASVTDALVHRLRHGHYLRPHHDRSGTRKIAYILYLSRDWEPQFGGQLTLVGQHGAKEQLEPAFNSLVLFDVAANKEHYIEELTALSKGYMRDTMSGWFLGEA